MKVFKDQTEIVTQFLRGIVKATQCSLAAARPTFLLLFALIIMTSAAFIQVYHENGFGLGLYIAFVCLIANLFLLEEEENRIYFSDCKRELRRSRKELHKFQAQLEAERMQIANHPLINKKFLRKHLKRKYRKALWEAHDMEPQMGCTDFLRSIVPHLDGELDSRAQLEIERIVALMHSLYQATSTTQALEIIYLYLSKFLDKSLTESIFAEVKAIVYQTEPQGFTDDWLDTFRECKKNWSAVVHNEGFTKVSRLISLLVGAGLVSTTGLNAKVGGLTLFSDMVVPKHVSALDLTDAVVETVSFFVEGAYECIRVGNMSPILFGDYDIQLFDENYLTCVEHMDYARAGNLKLLNTDEKILEKLFEDTLEAGRALLRTAKGTAIRRHLQDRVSRLQESQAAFCQYRQTGSLRVKTFGVGLFGDTGVGKSTIGNILMATILKYNNKSCTDEFTVVIDDRSRFWEQYRSYKEGVFLDDVGNTKPEFVEKSPTEIMLQVLNNVRFTAPMASLELKGKVSVEPSLMISTKNVKDSCAPVYSNAPASITRREEAVLTITVKPEFATNGMLDSSKVRKHYGKYVPIPDCWDITIETSFPIKNKTKGGQSTVGWKTYVYQGKEMKNVSIFETIAFLNTLSKIHFEEQGELVETNTNIVEKIEFCEKCSSPVCLCNSTGLGKISFKESEIEPSPMDKKRDEKTSERNTRRRNFREKKYSKQFGEYIRSFLPVPPTYQDLVDRVDQILNWPIMQWVNWIPNGYFESTWVQLFIVWWYGRLPRSMICVYVFFSYLVAAIIGHVLSFDCLLVALCVCFSVMYFYYCEAMLILRTVERQRVGTFFHNTSVRNHVKYITGGCVALSAIYGLCKLYRNTRPVFDMQGMMHPTSMKDIDEIDATDSELLRQEQAWDKAKLYVERIPVSDKSACTTVSQLKNKVETNLAFMLYKENGRNYASDAFFVASNLALIPRHAWKSDEMYCEFIRHDPSYIGGNFPARVSRSHSVDLPDLDLSLVWIPSGGTWKDMREYFPREKPKTDIFTHMLWKNEKGTIRESTQPVQFGNVNNGHLKMYGFEYLLKFKTFVGLCMGVHVSETKSPYITGFHLGGRTGKHEGCAGVVIRSVLDSALVQLADRCPSFVLGMSEGTLETEKYDVQFFDSPDIHEKSPLNDMPMNETAPRIRVFGSCKGRVTYYSDVVKSFISDAVEKVCNIPNKWGPPKFRVGNPFKTSLEHSANPSVGVEGIFLDRAVEDYMEPFEKLLADFHPLRESTRPMTRMETVCGIDGKKFMDKMPPNTSIGYPLSGPKSKYINYLDPELFEGFQCPAELDDIFWEEFDKAIECYIRGERYYPVFKACLKDEPTNKKVRVFQAAPIVLQMMTRMYFLPIVRILSLFPAISECAVGVNCMGPDWNDLSSHMNHFGKDRILAGDYSKYDLRMPAQVMFAAFRVLINIAILCGYDEESITIMRGIATDICYPVMAYNGDLLQLFGSNPSGQNLTVYINSIVNSLLFRCAFFSYVGVESSLLFRVICTLMTYGDDVKGSVRKGFDWFNHLFVAAFLAAHDMVFTMPDKTSEPTPFMDDQDADFLKRKNVYNPDLDLNMGALSEDSIFKSLHSNLKSKANTREKLAAENIDGALREWFNHGREHYEMRREQMKLVAEETGITHLCTLLNSSYDERLDVWKERYGYETQAGEYECFVERVVPILDDTGIVVDSFQVIDCGQGYLPTYLFGLYMTFVFLIVYYMFCRYEPQSGRYHTPVSSPRVVRRIPTQPEMAAVQFEIWAGNIVYHAAAA